MRPSRRLALFCALIAASAPARARAQVDPYEDAGAPPPVKVAPEDDLPLQEIPAEIPSSPVNPRPADPPAPAPAPPARDRPRAPALDAAPSVGASAGAKVPIRYTLEGIELRGNTRTAPRVVLRYVKFRAGDVIDVDDPEIELTRYRLLGAGFFASVQLSLRKGSRRGAAILVIEVEERNTFVLQNLWLGIAADEDTAGNAKPLSPFVGLQFAETNLAGTGVTLSAGIGLAEDQLALRTSFFDPAFAGTGWSVFASLLFNDGRDFFGNRDVSFESPLLEQNEVTDYAVVAYKRFGGSLGTGHDLSVSSRFQLDYHLEQIDAVVPTVASHRRGDSIEPIRFDVLSGKSALSWLRASFTYDTRDAPFLTRRGALGSVSTTIGLVPLGSDYGYQKIELRGQRWWQLPWKHVISIEAYAGGIAGDAPFFEKFFVGDFTDLLPDRVLELAPDRRQPPNFFRTDIIEVRYGDYAAKLEAEYRLPIYTGKGSIYGVDLFGAAGVYAVAGRREFSDPPTGYEGAARIPIDLTFNLGLRIDTRVGGLSLGFANLLGLVPVQQGVRK